MCGGDFRMTSPSTKALHAYVWNTGNSITGIRLLVEGAIALYEDDASGLYRLAMTQQKPVMALAFNTIGAALYDLRQYISKMPNDNLLKTTQQDDGNKLIFNTISYWGKNLKGRKNTLFYALLLWRGIKQ